MTVFDYKPTINFRDSNFISNDRGYVIDPFLILGNGGV